MAAPFLEFDLDRELEQLRREPEWESGQNSKTLVKYIDFRVVLTGLKPGRRIPAHQTDGRLSIQTLRGHVLIRAEGRTFDLTAGRVVALDRGIVHEIEAVDESAVLQTIVRSSQNDNSAMSAPV